MTNGPGVHVHAQLDWFHLGSWADLSNPGPLLFLALGSGLVS